MAKRRTIDPHGLTDNEISVLAGLLYSLSADLEVLTTEERAMVDAFEREAMRINKGATPKYRRLK